MYIENPNSDNGKNSQESTVAGGFEFINIDEWIRHEYERLEEEERRKRKRKREDERYRRHN